MPGAHEIMGKTRSRGKLRGLVVSAIQAIQDLHNSVMGVKLVQSHFHENEGVQFNVIIFIYLYQGVGCQFSEKKHYVTLEVEWPPRREEGSIFENQRLSPPPGVSHCLWSLLCKRLEVNQSCTV